MKKVTLEKIPFKFALKQEMLVLNDQGKLKIAT